MVALKEASCARVCPSAKFRTAHPFALEFSAFGLYNYTHNPRPIQLPLFNMKTPESNNMGVSAAQRNREMFAIKKSYSIEVSECTVQRTGYHPNECSAVQQ